jgi:hypothetical protein
VVLSAAVCDWNFESNEPLNAFTLRQEPVRVGAIANSTWSSYYKDEKRHWTIETSFDDEAIEVAADNQTYFQALMGMFWLVIFAVTFEGKGLHRWTVFATK